MNQPTLNEVIHNHPDVQAGRAIALTYHVDDVLSLQYFNMPVHHVISEDEAIDILRHIRNGHGTDLEEHVEHTIQQKPRKALLAVTLNAYEDDIHSHDARIFVTQEALEGRTEDQIREFLETTGLNLLHNHGDRTITRLEYSHREETDMDVVNVESTYLLRQSGV